MQLAEGRGHPGLRPLQRGLRLGDSLGIDVERLFQQLGGLLDGAEVGQTQRLVQARLGALGGGIQPPGRRGVARRRGRHGASQLMVDLFDDQLQILLIVGPLEGVKQLGVQLRAQLFLRLVVQTGRREDLFTSELQGGVSSAATGLL